MTPSERAASRRGHGPRLMSNLTRRLRSKIQPHGVLRKPRGARPFNPPSSIRRRFGAGTARWASEIMESAP